jgi:hypothetical protein
MTKDEYVKIKKLPLEKWTLSECHEADALIKREALAKAKIAIKASNPAMEDKLFDYINMMLDLHFGSVETDEMLIGLKAYPDWL